MKNKIGHNWLLSLKSLLIIAFLPLVTAASRPGWERKEVNWRMTGGGRVKAINYPKDRPIPSTATQLSRKSTISQLSGFSAAAPGAQASSQKSHGIPALTIDINSPPIDGFTPWIAVAATDERSDEFEIDAIPWTYVVGNYLTSNPRADYTIGLFDTGAAAHVISYTGATIMGLYGHSPDLISSNTATISGATDSVDAWVSQPMGLFIDGLGAIEPNGLLNHSWMVGETNVSVNVGDIDTSPQLPTAVGTPMSVYFSTLICNDRQVTINYDGNEYTGPDVRVYDLYDSALPSYPNTIPLELRPTGAVAVQYIPNYFDFEDPSPLYPSLITGFLTTQSLFFVSSVDLTHGKRSAIDKDGFMLDTGAQVSVISQIIATRLSLDLKNPDFEVEIMDVTGETTTQPGFYLDTLEFAATPDWLSYTNVPVVMLNVASPEGGYLDGIIGMNLFINFNFVLHGGSLPSIEPPVIEFERISNRLAADVAPPGGDGIVNFLDFAALADAWLATPASPNWNSDADLAPIRPDGLVNQLDFKLFAQYWGQVQAQ